MSVRELYDILGENIDEVIARLATEARVAKYLKRIPEDNSMELLEKALLEGDYEEGFRASHSFKGVSYNLGLKTMGDAASALCETMRNGAPTVDVAPLMAELKSEYAKVCACILDYIATEE